jgi:hypothetical protein
MRIKRTPPVKSKPKVAVVVDGETEAWYLQMLRRNEPQIAVDIKPELPTKKTLEAQYDKVCELSQMYDTVYWILDLDTVLKESQEAPKGSKKAIDTFLEYQRAIGKQHKNVTVIINNPCLEFWFLLHFEYTTKGFANCESAEKQLSKHFSGYEKTQKFFTRQENDIYLQLKPYLPNAIQYSKKLPPFDKDDANKSLSEMYKLFDALRLLKT